jgi:hypothetical protein
MPQQFAYFPLGGGLDLITPAIAQKPGSAIGALNYEPAANGYRRCDGYERFDGRTSPTDAPYYELDFTDGAAAFAAGEVIVGASSGATGKALADGVVTAGTLGGGDATGYVGLGSVSGVFLNGENLQAGGVGSIALEDGTDLLLEDNVTLFDAEGGVAKAKADGSAQLLVAPDDATAIAWQAAATAAARALILQVPGSGPVRGFHEYNGSFYAFRDNVGATAGGMWKASSAGWVAVALGYTIDFTSGGPYQIQEGDVVTGATSTKTATVLRIVTTSGSWAAGTAAGYMVVASASGAFVAENLNVGANLNVATIAADKAAITLPAGGRYDCINHNFYGVSHLKRMYGANGVGRAFEFDGTAFTPIRSGMAVDTPHIVREHKEHLWLFFPGGAFQNSSIGAPLDWSAITGAAAYGIGDEITNVISDNAGVMTVLAANRISNLYGTSSADFQLVSLSDESGALAYTSQRIGQPIYMDRIGIRSLTTSQAFGDFNIGTISEKVRPLLQDYARTNVNPVGAFVVRSKNHYRILFSNQAGLCFRFGKKESECLPFNWGKDVSCVGSFETALGERIFFGASDGFVYEADKGYSFDGATIDFSLRLPFNHEGAPQTRKRWHKVVAECQAIPQATISVSADFDYGDPFEAGATPQNVAAQVFNVTGGGGIWDISNWNQFYWSGATEGLMEAWLDGVGRNMSLLIAGSTADEPPHLLQGLTLFFTVRGLQR